MIEKFLKLDLTSKLLAMSALTAIVGTVVSGIAFIIEGLIFGGFGIIFVGFLVATFLIGIVEGNV